ncbi:MAG: sugar phosphate isomerase/epimerase [Nanoarchaeota archaeon]|nr:sugar phosphate isomerase/epimerase [Nanoarchaeota archaeon]MCG2717303.1 sugar phosphate isomerase/epimerase [Nanoarchaeota archaeon]
MNKKVCFATGNIWRWHKDRHELIKISRQFDFEGIEITLASERELFRFKPDKELKDFIKSLDYVSIHSPFRYHSFEDKQQKAVLNALQSVYPKINASNVVFHAIKVDNYDNLVNRGMNISIENLTPRSNLSHEDMKKILDINPKIGLTLDINHAMVHSEDMVKNLVKIFKDKVVQIHCSAYLNKTEHQPLHKADDEYLDKIDIVRKLNVPLVLEADFPKDSHDAIKKELEFLKNWY